jgi:glycosyltransferase involved in cell wall biosynthesis
MQPRGGTELQLEMLYKNCDNSLLDQVQICTSIPGKVPLHPDKLNILWQKNSYDQPNLFDFFSNQSRHTEYDWYVFNSHWNYEKFRHYFKIPTERSMVIKNGCYHFPKRKIYKKGDPIKLLYHSTPWRGLSVILGAMQYIKTPNVTLDVYSSTKIYGEEFHKENEHLYKPLFDQAKYLSNVNYMGYKPHEYILENITDYQMWTHPSVFEETFGIGALEAMSSGLYLITTNFGALFETCSEWPIYVNYTNNLEALAQRFAHAIDMACSSLHEDYIQQHIEEQQKFAQRFYSWDKKGKEWETFLKGALHERQSTRL